MRVYHWILLITCLLVIRVTCWRRRRRSIEPQCTNTKVVHKCSVFLFITRPKCVTTNDIIRVVVTSKKIQVSAAQWACATHPRLRDKWHFLEDSKRVYVRIRAHQVVYKHGSVKYIKYRCIENRGNIYLLRKRKYKENVDGVLCLGFSYVADHPKAEYAVLRFIGHGEGSHLLSPVLTPRNATLSIDSTCDLEGGFIEENSATYTTSAYIRRALPGCKFPPEIQGRWNFTYQHAKMLEIWQRNATLHLMSGQSIKFLCDKRDGRVFVFRTKGFLTKDEDGIMCAEFTPMIDDPFYSFQLSRHNSGNLLDGQLKSVSRSKPVYVHVDCDWIGSPARPEFLYP